MGGLLVTGADRADWHSARWSQGWEHKRRPSIAARSRLFGLDSLECEGNVETPYLLQTERLHCQVWFLCGKGEGEGGRGRGREGKGGEGRGRGREEELGKFN